MSKPAAIARVEEILGGRAESWERVVSRGYAVGERWIVRFDDGRSAFVKVGLEDWMVENMRAEMRVYSQLEAPFMPTLLAFDEEFETPLLVLQDLSGAEWPPPWRPDQIDAVIAAVVAIGTAPVPDGLSRLDEDDELEWDAIAADPEPFLTLGVASREWLDAALAALLAAERETPLAGDRLVHGDVRSDNLCIRDGQAILFDWNWAHVGNPTFDIAFWLPSLVLEGGSSVQEMVARRPEIDAFAASCAGFFAFRAGLPPVERAPQVREFQLAQLEIALPWAARVLDLPPPNGRIAA